LQWPKLTRDLVEQRNLTLDRIKSHLNGRDEVGSIREPSGDDSEVEFERTFRKLLKPWTEDDLQLECDRCHQRREDVNECGFYVGLNRYGHPNIKDLNACDSCYAKAEKQYEQDQAEGKFV
jgi:hypothetical protein